MNGWFIRVASARAWTRTFGARVFAVVSIGFLIIYGTTVPLLLAERYMSTTNLVLGNLRSQVSTAVTILDRLPSAERGGWLRNLNQQNFHISLGEPRGASFVPTVGASPQVNSNVADNYDALQSGNNPDSLELHLKLSDGQPLAIEIHRGEPIRLAPWLPYALLGQIGLIACLGWIAVRRTVRPLTVFAAGVDNLDPDAVEEEGPSEIIRAARVVNGLHDQISQCLKERMVILASISHDLQTPLTRLRLRIETGIAPPFREKLLRDVVEIQGRIREGVALARSGENTEALVDVHLGRLALDLIATYMAQGHEVTAGQMACVTVRTRPNALKVLLSILLDNSLMFAGHACVEIYRDSASRIVITVLDRGPGIDPKELEAVMQPFYRLEHSRNRETGGTGLGLAIAQQIAIANGARLRLYNRAEGGLSAEIVMEATGA